MLLLLMLFAPRELRTCLIANGDQQSCDVLAVLSRLLECGAGAVGGNAFTAELDRRLVRLWVRALDASGGARVRNGDALDDSALLVVETPQKRAGSKETAEAAIGESG